MSGVGKPPLELEAEVTLANGTTVRWDSQAHDAALIPQGLTFRTKRGDGFADASVTLSRRADIDYVDLNLLDTVTLVGADGSVAYEGRVGQIPRSVSGTHRVSLALGGWMGHARDRKFQEIYVDRDISRWGIASVQRRASSGLSHRDPSVQPDASTGSPSLWTGFTDAWAASTFPDCEALYDAQGIPIGSLYFAWKKGTNVGAGPDSWTWDAYLSTTDTYAATDTTGDLQAAGPGTGTLASTAQDRAFAMVRLAWDSATAAGTAGQSYDLWWTCLAVYGDHGLTKQGSADATNAQGFYASDVIIDIATRFCPKLNTSGVQQTSFVIPQLAFTSRTDPFDGFLEVNKYHLWDLGVWENKTLTYRPIDFTDYDWEVRLDDPGTTLDLQGDSTQDFANGIAIQYTDLGTQTVRTLSPETNPELADISPSNPANAHGLQLWTEATLSTPTTQDAALQFGRAILAEYNRPKSPGSINVVGHIRDRAGNWQQVWKVRAGDRILITDSPNDTIRLVVETSYTHDSHTLTMSIDNTFRRVDAVLDRLTLAVTAAGIR